MALAPIGPGSDALPNQPISPAATVTCKDINGNPMPVQGKTITIYNDSNEPIYPVIISGAKGVDQWMQACERTTAKPFAVSQIYKLFINESNVNGQGGIPAGGAVRVTLPLYSAISGGPDDHITWWNGGRVIVASSADGEHGIERLHASKPDPVDVSLTTLPAGVSCLAQGNTPCTLTTYSNSAGEPKEPLYAQLTEFTFGTIPAPISQPGVPLLRPPLVGYNISYVDQVYLPVAMEPAGNPYIGYSGSTVDLPTFAAKLKSFVTDPNSFGNDWTVYNMSELRLPATYNSFVQQGALADANQADIPVPWPGQANPPLLTTVGCIESPTTCGSPPQQAGKAVQRLNNLWASCVSWDPADGAPAATETCPAAMHSDMQLIYAFFKQNYQSYESDYNGPGCARTAPQVPFNYTTVLRHVYGWVPYNENCGNAGLNPLADTTVTVNGTTWTHAQVQSMYIEDLQYNYRTQTDPNFIFNPYVKLIHEDLDMNAYGFSVDDAVGFMQEDGSGLIYTVGGPSGLPNEGKFSYQGGFSVVLGPPAGYADTDKPYLKSYGVCVYNAAKSNCDTVKQDMTLSQAEQISGFRVGTVASYPIRVSLTDVDNNVYSFDVTSSFSCKVGPGDQPCQPEKSSIVSNCTVTGANISPSSSADWCRGANPNSAQDQTSKDPQTVKNFLSFGPPLVGSGTPPANF
ncbi:MAG: hypothetical protein EPN34_15120 [Burkholderiaceae bacterium]|nr:MAG: hypothetical protein EPN34_15120 [Burkholderiaceae bacterium]